jgi:hypothetical protein
LPILLEQSLRKHPLIPYLKHIYPDTWGSLLKSYAYRVQCSKHGDTCELVSLVNKSKTLQGCFNFVKKWDSTRQNRDNDKEINDPFRKEALKRLGIPYSGRISELKIVREYLHLLKILRGDPSEKGSLDSMRVFSAETVEIALEVATRPRSSKRDPIDVRCYPLALLRDCILVKLGRGGYKRLHLCLGLKGSLPSKHSIRSARFRLLQPSR